MTGVLHIDTLAFAKKLRDAGADERLAETIVEGINAADISSLATKTDLRDMEARLDGRMNGLEARMGQIEAPHGSDGNQARICHQAIGTPHDHTACGDCCGGCGVF